MCDDHDNLESVIRFALDELAEPDAARLRNELNRSPELQAELNAVRMLIADLSGDDDAPPSPEVVERVEAMLARRRVGARLGAIIVATLVFDSRRRPRVGLRGGADTCQLTFAAGADRLDMLCTPIGTDGGNWRVTGQLEAHAAGHVTLTAADEPGVAATIAIDERGYFAVDLPAGRYMVTLHVEDRTMLLEELQVG